MQYRTLGNSGINVSVIGHGTWVLGNDYFGNIDQNEAIKAIHASLDGGVNLIDTAAGYGLDNESEKLIGRALVGRRNQAVLATKTGVLRTYGCYIRCLNPTVMRIELEKSLKNLQTDYIDLFQIHWPDNNSSLEDALLAMLQFKKEGKIRAIGVSNFSVLQLQSAIDVADISSTQPQLSLLYRKSLEDGVIPFSHSKGLGIMTYGSLGGGILTGRFTQKPSGDENEKRSDFYPYYEEPMMSKVQELLAVLKGIGETNGASVAEVSINWVLAQPGITCALMGSSKPATAKANVKAANWSLSNEDLSAINDAYTRIFT